MTRTKTAKRKSRAKAELHPNDPYAGIRDASPLAPAEKAFLAEVLPPDRDHRTGRLVRGRLGGPGRTVGSGHGVYNFRALVKEYLARLGNHPEDIVAELFEDLMWASNCGDSNAARFLVERLCGKDVEQVDIALTTAKLSDVERAARIHAILASAKKSAAEGGG